MVSVGGPCLLAQTCTCGPLQPRACAHALRRRSGPKTCTSPASPTAARPSSARGRAPGARAFAGARIREYGAGSHSLPHLYNSSASRRQRVCRAAMGCRGGDQPLSDHRKVCWGVKLSWFARGLGYGRLSDVAPRPWSGDPGLATQHRKWGTKPQRAVWEGEAGRPCCQGDAASQC